VRREIPTVSACGGLGRKLPFSPTLPLSASPAYPIVPNPKLNPPDKHQAAGLLSETQPKGKDIV